MNLKAVMFVDLSELRVNHMKQVSATKSLE